MLTSSMGWEMLEYNRNNSNARISLFRRRVYECAKCVRTGIEYP